MSYMRGHYYLWRDESHLHLWAADGYDGWDDSVWQLSRGEASGGGAKASGVAIPLPLMDEFVVMRFAQLLEEDDVASVVDRAVSKYSGNGGCIALQEHLNRIKRVGSDLNRET